MASRKTITWAIIVLFSSLVTFSFSQGLQRYPIRVYSTNDGLSQSSVYHILKDKNEYIWVGTGDGLNQLTPRSVQVFKRDFNNETGLYDNAIRGMIEDPNGNIWIGTDRGLNVYSFDERKVTRKYKGSELPKGNIVPAGFYNGQIVAMKQNLGLFLLDPATGKISRQYLFKELFHADSHFFLIVQNFLWTATLDGRLLKLNLENGDASFIPLPDFEEFKNFSQIGPSLLNEIYIASDSSLYSLNTENGKWRKIFSFDGRISTFGFVNKDQIWVSLLGKGLCRLNRSGALLEPFVREISINGRDAIDLRTISTISQTDDGLVWLGVEGTGAVSIFPECKFQWITKEDPYLPGLSNSFIRSVAALNSNEILLGTYLSGLFNIDLNKEKITPIKYPDALGNDITALLLWKEDTLFLSSETGVWMLTGSELFHPSNTKRILNHNARQLSRIANNLIVSTSQGLYAFCPDSDSGARLIKPGNFIHAFPTQNELWTATTSGITVFDNSMIEIAEGGNQIAEYEIRSLYISEEKGVWVSTSNGLLNIDSKSFNILKQYTINQGLPNNTVYGVLSDGDRLWGSTNRGLFSLDILTDNISTYTQSDGLRTNEFNSGCFTHLSGSRMVFGGVNGLHIFTPESISNDLPKANVILKKTWINDKEIDLNELNVPLMSTQQNFVFEWDVLEWTHPEKIRLACKLTGQDTGWIALDTQNRIRYTALPPGDFELYTYTSNQNDSRGSKQYFISFNIAPPFYRTWWFITAIILGFALLFGTWIYQRAASRYQKKLAILEQQNEMNNLRKRISRDIHDDVGSDLSKMRMLLQQEKLVGHKVPTHLLKLQKLSEKALSGLSEVVWTVNSDYDRLPQMAAWFRTFAYDFFESEDIRVRFECPEQLPEYMIDPDMRRNLLMIYKEGLNNVVKHAAASQIIIRFDCSPGGLLSVEWIDNGVGFNTKKECCGNGMQNMRKRAETSGMQYTIISTHTHGTHITISGQLHQKYHESGR
ncbi:hypothetical protein G3O08_15600 [Cryomorpha ignava]|uniref:Signal transduction histidine kinase subgroup 3 dimerisation and phosphoacceptor domain-containing protein n=1 Tax=Cryomorpha ignava TaxID=101383 RepID=A0A7K3WWE3_9FLAO|nr:sensor histidine kinase [Cryomorpha ignava]NEN24925.1 hypothetical protein [Cryomorpha ignava]